MPVKIMKTLWDESASLESEILSPQSALSDSYTSGNIKELRERMDDESLENETKDDAVIE